AKVNTMGTRAKISVSVAMHACKTIPVAWKLFNNLAGRKCERGRAGPSCKQLPPGSRRLLLLVWATRRRTNRIKNKPTGAATMGADELLRSYAGGERDFRGINLAEVDLSGADLTEIDLRGANLHGANLNEANLASARLALANLSGALLHQADLHGANLE